MALTANRDSVEVVRPGVETTLRVLELDLAICERAIRICEIDIEIDTLLGCIAPHARGDRLGESAAWVRH
jgi:hypothetical protein